MRSSVEDTMLAALYTSSTARSPLFNAAFDRFDGG